MTTHDTTWHEELNAYRDGELPTLQQLAVRWHLASCAACREELLIMTQISEQLRSAESETFGPDDALAPALRHKILTSVAASAADPTISDYVPPPMPPSKWRTPHGREWAALGACAVVFGIAATTMLGSRPGFSPSGSGDMAATNSATTTTAVVPASSGTTASGNSAIVGTSSRNGNLAAAPESGAGAMRPNAKASPNSYAIENAQTFQRRAIGGPVSARTAQATSASEAQASSGATLFADGHVKSQRMAAPSGGRSPLAGLSALPPGATSTDNMPSSLRRVHKEGRVTVAVEKVEDQSDAVTQMVKSAGGFVADNALSTGANGLKTATLSLKVPVKQFETVMGQIARLGDVKAKNVVGEDITEKFSDVEQADRILGSELGVREAQLKEALILADTKRKRAIPVPWQQRAEVRELRIQAAQMRARLDLLKKISDLATIAAQIQEKPHLPKQTGFLGNINDNTASALDTFVVAARVPVNLLLWILAYSPLWLPLLVAYFCLNRIYRRA